MGLPEITGTVRVIGISFIRAEQLMFIDSQHTK